MKPDRLVQIAECLWELPRQGAMLAPVRLFGLPEIALGLDPDTLRQIKNVACLPGIVAPALLLPDAHSGYGFPIGAVAAFDARKGGIVCAGGVGFDIACGVRSLFTGLDAEDILARQGELADALFAAVPSGVGEGGRFRLSNEEIDDVLVSGARWAVGRGLGEPADLLRTEDQGQSRGADPDAVSSTAKARLRDQLGTLGSGNHYLEVQAVERILDAPLADALGLRRGEALLSVHCGSRGLGHQIGQDFLPRMAADAKARRLALPDRDLACAPILSELGQEYLSAMHCGVNCALANRQVIAHLARGAFAQLWPKARLRQLYDVAHNICRAEEHPLEGKARLLHVHRKGATRALGPGHPALPADFRQTGQPVLIGGSMGTASYVLVGTDAAGALSFASACHGAGRAMSRSQARKRHKGADLVESLRLRGVFIRSADLRGVAEEAPAAYKDVDAVVESCARAGLVRIVARLAPLICVKG
ncbi:MAG: RtcB family protein [Humidesulfovibrio sp.]